eukprot:TRINITY_DN8882_c0_g1_i3.p1 TRINITY_DN8882_c0_g1~~TRINITY_DN8882_c0_g1_i3.p1  ORF type:complete len:234 (+),score=47.96 TRINITY_DN8882_c0_g1_i3:195-896(+)
MADEVALAAALQKLPEPVNKAILFGNTAAPLAEKNGNNTHTWKVYVRSPCDEDLSEFIRKVTFTLHSSFKNANRTIEQPPFEVEEEGWGEFDIQIKIHLHDPIFKPVHLKHFLKLFPSDDTTKLATGGIVKESFDELVFPAVDPPSQELGVSSRLVPEYKTESGIDYHRIETAALLKMTDTLKRVRDSLQFIKGKHAEVELESKRTRADIEQLQQGQLPERLAKLPKLEQADS